MFSQFHHYPNNVQPYSHRNHHRRIFLCGGAAMISLTGMVVSDHRNAGSERRNGGSQSPHLRWLKRSRNTHRANTSQLNV